MKKYWWIVCITVYTTESDGLPDSDNYPVEKKEIFKLFSPHRSIIYENFCEKISKFFANYNHATKKINFVWCLEENGKEDYTLADLLKANIKEKLPSL